MQKLFENWRSYQKEILNESPPSLWDDYEGGVGGETPVPGRRWPLSLEDRKMLQRVEDLKACTKGDCKHVVKLSQTGWGAELKDIPMPRDVEINKVWDYDPRELSFEQWLEKHGFEYAEAVEPIPGRTLSVEEFYDTYGYSIPSHQGGGMDWGALDVPDRPGREAGWVGPNRAHVLGLSEPGSRGKGISTGIFTPGGDLKELHREERLLYDHALKIEMRAMERELTSVARQQNVMTKDIPDPVGQARTTFHAKEEKALLKELDKALPEALIPGYSRMEGEFIRMKEKFPDASSEELARHLAEDLVDNNIKIAAIIDPSSREGMPLSTEHYVELDRGWRPASDGRPRLRNTIEQIHVSKHPGLIEHFQHLGGDLGGALYHSSLSPHGYDLMVDWVRADNVYKELTSKLTPQGGYMTADEWRRKNKRALKSMKLAMKNREKAASKIRKLAAVNARRLKAGKPPSGVTIRGYKPEPGVIYDKQARIERLADALHARFEVEMLGVKFVLSDKTQRMTKAEMVNIETRRMVAATKVLETDYNVTAERHGKEAAKEMLEGRLKKLPFIGRIVAAGFLTDAMMKAFIKGHQGSEPGAEGLWAFTTDTSKEGMPYLTATMMPWLGETLDIKDIFSSLPSWEQQVDDMRRKGEERRYERERKEEERRYERERKEGEKGFQQKAEDYEIAVKQAKEHAKKIDGIIDPLDPRRVWSRTDWEAEKRRRAAERSEETPFRGSPVTQKAKLRESKTKKINIVIG